MSIYQNILVAIDLNEDADKVIETEVHRVAIERNSDLIIVGSHGRHGLALFLGSTSNGILHGATCDVLAVRV